VVLPSEQDFFAAVEVLSLPQLDLPAILEQQDFLAFLSLSSPPANATVEVAKKEIKEAAMMKFFITRVG